MKDEILDRNNKDVVGRTTGSVVGSNSQRTGEEEVTGRKSKGTSVRLGTVGVIYVVEDLK